jgi:hypothetical protein
MLSDWQYAGLAVFFMQGKNLPSIGIAVLRRFRISKQVNFEYSGGRT